MLQTPFAGAAGVVAPHGGSDVQHSLLWGSVKPLWQQRGQPGLFVSPGSLCCSLCPGDLCGELGGAHGPLDHHRPQRGHDAGPAHQRRQPHGPQGTPAPALGSHGCPEPAQGLCAHNVRALSLKSPRDGSQAAPEQLSRFGRVADTPSYINSTLGGF